MPPTKTANTWTVDEVNAIFAIQGCGTLRGDVAELSCSSCECGEDPRSSGPGGLRADPSVRTFPLQCSILAPSATVTNRKFLFLREIGGAKCLKMFLDNVRLFGPKSPYWGGTLIIDDVVSLSTPLVIPAFFTLAGTGISGEGGRIEFKGDFGTVPAISFQAFNLGSGTIRDLAIFGPETGNAMRGVKIGPTQFVPDNALSAPRRYCLHRVQISRFGEYGVQGAANVSDVTINACQIADNGVNVQLLRRCDGWRIRDCLVMRAATWGIDVGATVDARLGALRDLLISGCRFEGNAKGAIMLQQGVAMPNPADLDGSDRTFGISIFGNSFEANATRAVNVEHGEAAARLIGNFFGPDESIDLPSGEDSFFKPVDLGTHIGFNTAKNSDPELNTLKTPFLHD